MKPKPSNKTQTKHTKYKPQPKHLQTFGSSSQQKSKQIQASVTSLTIARPESKIVRKIVQKKKKKTHCISKSKIRQIDQQFEKIAYKDSHSQSFIVFSNDETQREQKDLCYGIKNVQHIQSITENTVNPNLVLRVNIKKQYIRKTQAATKIQKVMRGFMTRKVLNKCIEEQEEKLRNQLGNSSRLHFDEVRQNQTHRTFIDKDTQVLVNKLFANKNNYDANFNHTTQSRTDFYEQAQHQNYFQQIGLTFPKKDIYSQRQNISKAQQNNERMEEQSDYESEEEEDSQMDESSEMIYRRQNPIYSQSQISHYLQSSEQQEQVDEYEPDIIFQTNEQYLESRKSSLQNKNQTINKLSNKGLSDIALIGIATDNNIRKQLRANNQDICNEKGEEFDKHHISTLPDEDQLLIKKQNLFQIQHKEFQEQQGQQGKEEEEEQKQRKYYKQFDSFEKNLQSNEQKQKQQIALQLSSRQKHRQQKIASPKRQSKYLDEQFFKSNSECHSNRTSKSKKSNQQKEILRLKEQQREKWQQVIQMVSHQIKKNQESSGQMSNFMQTIMDLSQKNKELLESTCSVNSQSQAFCTPTSYGMNVLSTIQAKSCPINEKQDQFGQHSSQERIENKDNNVKFFKKKPLKIDVSDENLFEIKKSNLSQFPQARIFSRNKMEIQKQKSFSKKSINHSQRSQFSKEFRTIDEKQIEGLMIKKEFPQTDDSKKLKNFLSSNIQDSAVYDILKLRQQLLQNRESEELAKLNNLLSKKQLSQQDFLKELSGLTNKFLREKELIDKSKEDILKGYQAANDLVKQYFFDVRRMGIKLAVSRSQDNLKYKVSQSQNFMNEIQIDQLPSKIKPKNKQGIKIGMKQIFGENQIQQQRIKQISSHNFESSQESSIDFTQQQLKRFRKAANYDLQFNDLNKNLAISEDFINQQRKYVQQQFTNNKKVMQSPVQTIQPLIQTYQLDDKLPCLRTPPHIQSIIESEVQTLVWQFAAQLMVRPSISDKFIDRNTFVKPLQISNEERNNFLKILQENLPEIASLNRKLNQNITPLPSEILKCMRLDFSEDNEDMQNDQNYEEVNKYQFVISQESCAKSVMLFKNAIDQIQEQNAIDEQKKNTQNIQSFDLILKGLPIVDKIQNFIRQRSKFMQNRRQRTRELRWEVMNIELHCIFDSWNQEIVQICSTRAGFSGIGLNQLTLSLINHNKLIPISQTLQITQQSKQKVIEILNDDMDINAKILQQNYRQMCKTDSAWIFYADEALSYALELVYLVEQQIYTQIVKELRKIMVKSSFLI